MQTPTFFSVLVPLLYCTKIFGLTPFRLGSKYFGNSKLDLAYSLALMILFGASSYMSLDDTSIKGTRITSQVMSIISLHLNIISVMSGILLGCVFKNKILACINDMATADRNLSKYLQIDTDGTYSKTRSWVTLIALSATGYLVLLWSVNSAMDIDESSEFSAWQIFLRLVRINCPMVTSLVDLQFCCFVVLLKQRFGLLNRKVELVAEFFDDQERRLMTSERGTIDAVKTLEKVKFSHNRLCKIAENVNEAYAFQLLLLITQTFIVTVLIMFYFLKLMVSSEWENDFTALKFSFYTFHFLLNMGQLFALVFSCSNTVEEAQQTKTLIYETTVRIERYLTNQSERLDLNIKTIKFSLQYLDRNLEFSACSLFAIDKDLLFSIGGAITTYCVIVLQFELNK